MNKDSQAFMYVSAGILCVLATVNLAVADLYAVLVLIHLRGLQ